MSQKTDVMQIRLSPQEKEGFQLAAELSGISLSAWMRERLRRAATRELEDAGQQVPFAKLKRDE